ncbi:helix-turn-helix domain-containing protein [Gordonia sp. NPDC003585]|uniref:IclR family transcriptional regulator n=1 Tax=unclassified Gordonia (in: high G+C Gram-positive bacteria) TaxID=2657482 RepID=UPI0033AE5E20
MTHTVGDPAEQGQQPRSPSPPTARVMRVVELLVRSAPDTLTLAQIVRLTGQSRATAHAVASEMVDRGWATRHPRTGEFGLGPAFVALARTAQSTDLLGQWAGPAVRNFADEHGMPCFLARRIDAETISVVEHALPDDGSSRLDPAASWFRPGRRIRLRPPICREFIAWSSPTDRTQWIEQAPASVRTRLAIVLDEIRERGYSIERLTPDHIAMIDALSSLDGVSDSLRSRVGDLLSELGDIDYLDTELSDDTEHGVVTLGTPVFDAGGTVVASLVACPGGVKTGYELRELAESAVRAAEWVSTHL